MTKRVLLAILGLAAFCLPVRAQETNVSEQMSATSVSLNLSGGAAPDRFVPAENPMLSSLNGSRFLATPFLEPVYLAPIDTVPMAFMSAEGPRNNNRRLPDTEAPLGPFDLRARGFDYGGEVGVYYGKSTGKYGGEQFGSYIFGTVGNDKVQITAGASYEESHFRFPRGTR